MDQAQTPQKANELDLLESVILAPARGKGKMGLPLSIEVVRSLTIADLPVLANMPPGLGEKKAGGPQSVASLRQTHHAAARALATGSSLVEVSIISGYSVSYLSVLQGNSAFKELMQYYQIQKEEIFLDTARRMRDLGMASLEELQERLANEPEKWTKRELMDMAKLLMIDGRQVELASKLVGRGGGVGVRIEVDFVDHRGVPPAAVTAPPAPAQIDPPMPQGSGPGPLIEAEIMGEAAE